MAYITRSGGSYRVHKGNSGEVLSTFSGRMARRDAEAELQRLHRKYDPEPTNRGRSAQRREEMTDREQARQRRRRAA